MATHKSALKRHRQSLRRKTRNHAVKSRLRTLVKRVRAAIAQQNTADAESGLQIAARELDKAVSKGVLHRNSASRRLSRLSVAVNRLRGAASAG